MKYVGQVISEGIAWGKAKILSADYTSANHRADVDQTAFFLDAIAKVSDALSAKIVEAETRFDDRICGIFQAHEAIVNDPIVKADTLKHISAGMTAIDAYGRAVNDILKKFEKVEDTYMLGRVVDIIDATDRVKAVLSGKPGEELCCFDEETILILDQLKPSVIYATPDNNITGFISVSGSYSQHSGIIARTIHIPGIVCPDILSIIKDDDIIIIDANLGEITINPEKDEMETYIKEVIG